MSSRFARGNGGTGELKYTDNERCSMVVWKTRYMEHTWSNMYTVYGMRQRRPNFFPCLKNVPKTQVFGCT